MLVETDASDGCAPTSRGTLRCLPGRHWSESSLSEDPAVAHLAQLGWTFVTPEILVVDYVVAHELVHLVHEGHGRAFWSALGRVVPDYERRKSELAALGPQLVW